MIGRRFRIALPEKDWSGTEERKGDNNGKSGKQG